MGCLQAQSPGIKMPPPPPPPCVTAIPSLESDSCPGPSRMCSSLQAAGPAGLFAASGTCRRSLDFKKQPATPPLLQQCRDASALPPSVYKPHAGCLQQSMPHWLVASTSDMMHD